jgi:hypothetical protein
MKKPIVHDLYCISWCVVQYCDNGHKSRKGSLGKRILPSQEIRLVATGSWRKPSQTWPNKIPGASFVAFHDDTVCLERSRTLGLDALSGQGNYYLRKMARVYKFLGRYGAKANFKTYIRSDRFGREL